MIDHGQYGSGRSLPPVAVALAGAAAGAGALAGHFVASGKPLAVLALAAIVAPIVLWERPHLAPAMLVIAALSVEQFNYAAGLPAAETLTARIPLFHGIGNLRISPADVSLALLFAFYVAKIDTPAVRSWPRTPLATAVFALLAAVAVGVLLGLARGGELRVALMETRPYVYVAATYVLASVFLTTRTALRAVLWGFVLAVGAKAAQGLTIFLSVRDLRPRPEAVLGHEEALFFGVFLLLTLALWLFEVGGPLRTTATVLAPIVLAADLANGRRASWLLLAVGLLTLLAVGYVSLPHRRRFIARLLAVLLVVTAAYLPMYWDKSGGFAQPARAIRSAFAPTERDRSSDLYRIQEDLNLLYNIGQAGPLGRGFGLPIDYALPIEDISDIDPLIAYIPHNGVFYIFYRTGIPGGIAFWAMLGIGIITACRLAKSRDREIGLLGAVITAFLVAYAFEGYTDQGFFFYRIAFIAGTMLGLAEAARRLAPELRVAAVPPSTGRKTAVGA